MTDNEKRSHDLVIVLMMEEYRSRKASTTTTEFSFDYYREYTNAYDRLLCLFNRDYPSGEVATDK